MKKQDSSEMVNNDYVDHILVVVADSPEIKHRL